MVVMSPPEKSLVVPEYPIWRLTVEQYHAMIETGILTDDDPVELLEGWLITKMSKNRPHSITTYRTRDALTRVIPSGWYVDAQEPITTVDSEPEPDVVVVQGNVEDYPERQPLAEKVALVVEVSDATLQRDRTLKLQLYARARIPIYWILNLQDRQLEVYSDPATVDEKEVYRQRTVYREADDAPVIIGSQEVGKLNVGKLLA